jgi:23S rRNA (uracil1939-C5)-methyltransferase
MRNKEPADSENQLELTIESIVAGGDGLARRPDNRVVFVPRTAPGERIEATVTEGRRQWMRARLSRVIEPSPDRVEPQCPHYDRCGGCQLQHIEYGAQLRAKAGIVADAFRRLGGLDVPTVEVEPSPRQLGYRNRISVVLQRSDSGSVTAGFRALGSIGGEREIVDIDACPLAEDPINKVWAELRTAWGDGASELPKGRELRLTLRANHEGRVGLAIDGSRGGGHSGIARLVEGIDMLDSVWILGDRGAVARHAGSETMPEQLGGYEIPLAGTAFTQVNRDAAEAMNDYVVEQCGDVSKRRVVDAYCGFGTRTVALARAGAITVGIDFDTTAIESASRLAREAGLGAAFISARVERRIRKELPAEVVIVNPPRSGIAADVTRYLLERPGGRLIYVSCDPATLARDLGRLAPRYRLTACRAFDLFPQTSHVETVATLVSSG